MGRKKILSKAQKKICKVLKMFLRYYSTGLLTFFSPAYEFPDDTEIVEMYELKMGSGALEQVHVQGGDGLTPEQRTVELADKIVHSVLRRYGGLELWRNEFAKYRAFVKSDGIPEGRQFSDVLILLSRTSTSDIPDLEAVAEKCGKSPRRIAEIRETALRQIAKGIELASYETKWRR